jgi:hypothetical protein
MRIEGRNIPRNPGHIQYLLYPQALGKSSIVQVSVLVASSLVMPQVQPRDDSQGEKDGKQRPYTSECMGIGLKKGKPPDTKEEQPLEYIVTTTLPVLCQCLDPL